jgi:tRNA (mo5U34)-methyltransferase
MTKSMEEIQWWHQVPLDDGRITPGLVAIYKLGKTYLFDDVDFKGKSVLDIGAWDGYFSFTAEKRGATRVVALDSLDFRRCGLDGFNFLHDHFKSSVEWTNGTIYKLPDEMFDVVLCFGVLYHLTDPLLAAVNCFERSNELVLVEGVIYEGEEPKLTLLEPPYKGDPSNTYSMTTGYMKMVARIHGFELVKHHQSHEHRGAMMFKRTSKVPCPYKPSCFPITPPTFL